MKTRRIDWTSAGHGITVILDHVGADADVSLTRRLPRPVLPRRIKSGAMAIPPPLNLGAQRCAMPTYSPNVAKQVVPNKGERYFLDRMLRRIAGPADPMVQQLRLYRLPSSPPDDSFEDLADFTQVTAGAVTMYNPMSLDPMKWGPAATDGSGVTSSIYTPAVSFTINPDAGGAYNVYGFYVVDNNNDTVLFAGHFDAVVPVNTAATTINVPLKFIWKDAGD